jgi:hypothetical protein
MTGMVSLKSYDILGPAEQNDKLSNSAEGRNLLLRRIPMWRQLEHGGKELRHQISISSFPGLPGTTADMVRTRALGWMLHLRQMRAWKKAGRNLTFTI